ncbi:MAG TPA: EamA family transporter [Candidatus Limnocylindria bacterium]
MDRLDPRGAAAATMAAVLYGSAYVATAFALRSFTPLGAAAARGLLGAALLGAILLAPAAGAMRPARLSTPAMLRLGVLGLLGGGIFIVAMNVAVAMAGATVTAFVAGLYAVLAAALAVPLLGERPEGRTIVSLAVALVGTALLGDLRHSADLAVGIGVGLVAAVSFALFLVFSRRWSGPFGLPGPSVALVALGMSGIGIGALIPILGDPGLDGIVLPEAAAAVIWLAVGPGALAAVLVVTGMRRLPARRASAFLLLNPPTAALGGWLLLGERLSVVQLAGGALVLLAMAGASGLALPRFERRA